MSTYVKTQSPPKTIRSVDDLKDYFQRFSKPKAEARIGIECELFGVEGETGAALPYRGSRGIEAVLNTLAVEFGYEKIRESGHTIALRRGPSVISLEPGGQVELSAEPIRCVHHAAAQLNQFFFELSTVSKVLGGIAWLGAGIHPFSSLGEIEWVPKRRYEIMAKYLGARGGRAHDMMKRTAANQINFDYENEQDAMEKIRLSFLVTPIAAALFANSSVALGRARPLLAERLRIWRATDPDRTGFIFKCLSEGACFEDYLNYALDIPMIFLVRAGRWIRVRNVTFRNFIEKGRGRFRPTEADFELHLSAIFTDVRFRRYLEIRGMDGQRKHLIPAVFAFWKGILYDDESRRAAAFLLSRFQAREIAKLHRDVERLGLRANIQGVSALELSRELVRISEEGLKRQSCLNDAGEDERIYLGPLKDEVLKKGITPAETLARLFETKWKRNPQELIRFARI